MDTNTHLTENSPHELTWKQILLSSLGGYMCIVLFFTLGLYSKSELLFSWNGEFSAEVCRTIMVVFLIAYTMYAANKSFWFSLRKNGYFSAVYGSIRRFFETYARCLYIGFIPFCFLAPLSPRNVSWDIDAMANYAFLLYGFLIWFSMYLIVLILAQRFIVSCYRVATKKPIGKPEDNARFWQTTKTVTPVTPRTIFRPFALIIWEFGYWIAMVVLLPAVFYLAACAGYLGPVPTTEQGLSVHFIIMLSTGPFLCIACYLAFSIILQSLFRAVWQTWRGTRYGR